jgi:hypothetical protein
MNSLLKWKTLANSVGNFSPAIGAQNQVGIGLSYRPASLCSLAIRFLEWIPRPIAGLKFPTQKAVEWGGWDAPPPPSRWLGGQHFIQTKPKMWQKYLTKYGGKCIDATPSLNKMIFDV